MESPGPRKRRNRKRRFRHTWLKHAVVYGYYWSNRSLSSSVAYAGYKTLIALARLGYRLPRNPIRKACEDLSVVCASRGHHFGPHQIYRDFLRQFDVVAPVLQHVYHSGPERAREMVRIGADDRARIDRALEEHRGLLVAIPHNVGAALSGIGFSNAFPTLFVGKNGDAAWRAEIAMEVFARMGIDPLLVRGRSPLRVSRKMVEAMTGGRVVVATLDNVFRKPSRIDARIFGGKVGFSPWAVRLAVTARAPVLPAYICVRGQEIRIRFGEILRSDDVEQLTQHYVSFFEEQILGDPSSWAFLAHKRWRLILHQARAHLENGNAQSEIDFELRSASLRKRER